MSVIRDYSRTEFQNGGIFSDDGGSVHSPVTKTVGNRFYGPAMVRVPAGAVVTVWDYSESNAQPDWMNIEIESFDGVSGGNVDIYLEIVKPTSTNDKTPDGAWARFVSILRRSCGAKFKIDDFNEKITVNRALMGTVDGGGVPYPAAAAGNPANVTEGYIRTIKAYNPGSAAVTLKKWYVFP